MKKNRGVMFSIGLFSTYLPYVILAMFYGLYVGVHSIMKIEMESSSDDKDLAAKTIYKDSETDRTGAAGKTCYYEQFAVEKTTTADLLIHRSVGKTILFPEHEDPVPEPSYPPLFSRPPPALSL